MPACQGSAWYRSFFERTSLPSLHNPRSIVAMTLRWALTHLEPLLLRQGPVQLATARGSNPPSASNPATTPACLRRRHSQRYGARSRCLQKWIRAKATQCVHDAHVTCGGCLISADQPGVAALKSSSARHDASGAGSLTCPFFEASIRGDVGQLAYGNTASQLQ